MMTIGDAARQSGLSAKRIRHYEEMGLLGVSRRSDAGYRQFDVQEVQVLQFIRQARSVGFSLPQIRMLLSLWQDKERASADVKRLAQAHIADLDRRIQGLAAMRDTLNTLTQHCYGDHRPDCPILQGLADAAPGEPIQ